MKSQQVAHNESDCGFAIVQDQASRMKLVMHVGRRNRQKPADDFCPEWGSDVAGRSTSRQYPFRRLLGIETGYGQRQNRQTEKDRVVK